MTSAAKLLGMPHQLLMTALPAAQLSRTRFARMPRFLLASGTDRAIPPAGAGEVKNLLG
jgi:hypothetical protein